MVFTTLGGKLKQRTPFLLVSHLTGLFFNLCQLLVQS